MDAIEQLKDDLRSGRIDVDRLVDLIVTLQRELQAANKEIEAANQRIEELEKQCGTAVPGKVDKPFSVRAEEKRQEVRGKKKRKRALKGRRGRVTTAEKIKLAERTEDVFPEGVDKSQCKRVRSPHSMNSR